jgi:hypothetical protein
MVGGLGGQLPDPTGQASQRPRPIKLSIPHLSSHPFETFIVWKVPAHEPASTPSRHTLLEAVSADVAGRAHSRVTIASGRQRTRPLSLALVVILAVIPPGPTAANQTALNGIPTEPDQARTYWSGLSGRWAVIS